LDKCADEVARRSQLRVHAAASEAYLAKQRFPALAFGFENGSEVGFR
jgi:hypothetical protein